MFVISFTSVIAIGKLVYSKHLLLYDIDDISLIKTNSINSLNEEDYQIFFSYSFENDVFENTPWNLL